LKVTPPVPTPTEFNESAACLIVEKGEPGIVKVPESCANKNCENEKSVIEKTITLNLNNFNFIISPVKNFIKYFFIFSVDSLLMPDDQLRIIYFKSAFN